MAPTHQIRIRIVVCLAAILFLEIVARLAVGLVFDAPLLRPRQVIRHFYPELARADSISCDPDRINVLVLGGSVVTHQVLKLRWNDEDVTAEFCNMEKLLPQDRYNVLSLAMAGHNSMDSKVKYKYLGNKARFDAVFVYHGINDTRTNNIARERFDPRYRHIEFYDDLFVFTAHPEISITATPFIVHWLIHSLRTRGKEYLPKELFYGLLFGEPEGFLADGEDIKSDAVFRSNFLDLIARADQRGEFLVLSTYAWHLPADYDAESFKDGLLDYDQQVFPTELYGLPENVRKGLESHNAVIRTLHAEHPECGFMDMEAAAIRSREHFNDVCHLNRAGCALMAEKLADVLMGKFAPS